MMINHNNGVTAALQIGGIAKSIGIIYKYLQNSMFPQLALKERRE
ncbi:MAG: hypothetical protein ACOX0D_06065 [Sphaerochaeta sp.]|jgi:hypothetical protein